jgi:transcriptional antiterminator NusG
VTKERTDTPADDTDQQAAGASKQEASAESPSGKASLATAPGMAWYVLRVASNKEDQVRESLERKVKIEALQDRIGRILVPTVREKRMKSGQARIFQKKLYPGYVFVEMKTEDDGSVPENVWFMIKETMGVGDFIHSDNKPTAMRTHEVERMLLVAEKPDEGEATLGIQVKKGDRVKIREGSFEGFEGNVELVDEQKGVVTVLITIFGRSTPVDVEYWQVEPL